MAFPLPATTAGGFVQPRPQTGWPLAQLAWQRKGILVVGLLVGLGLGVLVNEEIPPTYQSTAQVLVERKVPDAATGVDMRTLAVDDYVSMHQGLIQSPLIIDEAIRRGRLAMLPSFAGSENLTRDIIKALSVTHYRTPSGDNNILQLSFRAGQAADCRVVLDAILESYQRYVAQKYRATSDEAFLQVIARARDLRQQLAQKNAAYERFRETSPLVGKGQDSFELRRKPLEAIQARLSVERLRRIEIEGELQAVENGRKQGLGHDVLLAMVAQFSSKPDPETVPSARPVTLQDQLLPLLLEEQKLLERYGPNHPEVQNLRQRIDATRAFFANPSPGWQESSPQPARTKVAPTGDAVALHVQYLRQKLRQIDIEERRLAAEFAGQEKEAKDLTSYQLKDEHLLADIAATRLIYEDISKRLPNVKLVKDVGGYDATVIGAPTAGRKVSPHALLVFPAMAFLGLLAGLGLAWVAAARDQAFHTPQEVREHLGLPVMGFIPRFRPAVRALPAVAPAARANDLMLCAHYQSHSGAAEAFRGVRTALYFGTPGEDYRVIQVTSPNAGDGKTTLAANLAVSIAQSGKRTVLVDADLRQPRVHQVFGLTGAVGLSSVLAEGVDPLEAVQVSDIPGLSVLPAGPLPPNPAELLTSPRFEELRDWLRDRFDFVVVDSPALLGVTDASVIASRVDGVLLVLRLSRNGRPAGTRASEMLTALGATVLGVIVNGADGQGTFGGYAGTSHGQASAYASANGT